MNVAVIYIERNIVQYLHFSWINIFLKLPSTQLVQCEYNQFNIALINYILFSKMKHKIEKYNPSSIEQSSTETKIIVK
jgi:hypothetical protein